MATKSKEVTTKVVEKVEEPVAEVNPAIDPNLSAQERLDSLTEQQAKMRQDQADKPDYPVK